MKNNCLKWYKKDILVGSIIGLLIGISIILLGLFSSFPTWYYYSIGLPFVLMELVGRIFGCKSYSCLIPSIIGGLFIFMIIGTIIKIKLFHKNK